ncbi:MAG TPA: VOC family protein, partial [Longimicrobiales bacterium]|nr:VOC family protein [Longimicrobiales bacterium]
LGGPDGPVLVELREQPGVSPPPRAGRLGLYHFAVLLPDRATLGRLARHFSALGVPHAASDHAVSEALYLSDPDGLGIEVYADRPRAEWPTRGEELAMTTAPLDMGSLLDAAGAEPWSGAPAGTTLGHVHLHVGDMAAAARFYHEALGLDTVVWSYPGALFLSAGGYHHHLGLNTWAGPRARAAPDGEARLLEWGLVLPAADDVEATAESLRSAGVTVEPVSAGVVVVADPWGTRLRLSAADGDGTAGGD